MLHINERCTGEHDSLKEKQTQPLCGIVPEDDAQEVVQFQQWHVGVDILDVAPQQLVPELDVWYRQSTFRVQVIDVVFLELRWERTDVIWENTLGHVSRR